MEGEADSDGTAEGVSDGIELGCIDIEGALLTVGWIDGA